MASPKLQEQAQFVIELSGNSASLQGDLQLRDEKAQRLEELVGKGMDQSRDAMRKVMNFEVERLDGKGSVKSIDERGQRKSLEVQDVGKIYKSLSDNDLKELGKQFQLVLDKKKQMQEAVSPTQKDQEGKPARLFTASDIITELFQPLIREKLLPDTLVADEDSPVAQMLKAVIESYKDMLRQQIVEKEQARSKVDSDRHNMGSKTDRLLSLGGTLSNFVEGQISTVASMTGMTSEEMKRAAALTGKSVKVVSSIAKSVSTGLETDKKLKGPKSNTVNTVEVPPKMDSKVVVELVTKLDEGSPDSPVGPVLQEVNSQLAKANLSLDQLMKEGKEQVMAVLAKFTKLMKSDGVAIAGDVVQVLIDGTGGVLDNIETGGERTQAGLDIDVAVRKAELRAGLYAVVRGMQAALDKGLKPQGMPLAATVSSAFATAVDVDAEVEYLAPAVAVKPDTRVDAGPLVQRLGNALSRSMTDTAAALKPCGPRLSLAYIDAAKGAVNQLNSQLKEGNLADPANAFLVLVEPTAKAVSTLVSDPAFTQALQDKELAQQLQDQARIQNQDLQDELDASEEEIEDFERQLVLMDEGGMDMGRQKTLDVMIAQLKADQLDLEIVLKAGSLLSSFGSSVTQLGTDSKNVSVGKSLSEQAGNAPKTVATEVATSMLPALEAAELVMKMTVTVIKIARRAELARKFKADVDKARKAGSFLLDSVKNFYSNKVQQQVFAGIELALQIVQLAGAVCASVPEPITMAVGRALNAAAKAGEATRDLAQSGYNEKTLRKGWKVTLDAINNPGNRRMGLEALRRNSTLAVHSVAWAATTQGDSMAMEILRSCGVDAQTMADKDSDKDKVVEYLETLLHEDMQFKDVEKLNVNWAPTPLVASYVGWFTLKARAREANPPLAETPTPGIDQAFKAADIQPAVHVLLDDLHTGNASAYPRDKIAQYIKEAVELKTLLANYRPVSTDATPHDEMARVVKQMAELVDQRMDALVAILETKT